MRRRAFSLLEMLISCLLLSVLTAVLFVAFRDGTRAFNNLSVRQGLEGEARRCTQILDQLLRQSDASCCEAINPSSRQRLGASGVTVSRDGLAYVNLTQWWDASHFDSAGRPQWDQYEVIYATLYNPGHLVRQIYRPAGAPYQVPLPGFTALAMLNDDPADNSAARETHLLSQRVEDFQVDLQGDPPRVDIQLILTDREPLRAGSQRASQERMQVDLTIQLNNSRT